MTATDFLDAADEAPAPKASVFLDGEDKAAAPKASEYLDGKPDIKLDPVILATVKRPGDLNEYVDPSMTMADVVGGRGGSDESARAVFHVANLPLSYIGNVARGMVADVAAGMRADPAVSGNLPAALMGQPLPVDEQLRLASDEAPIAATVGKISQGVAAAAPLMATAALPKIAQRLVAAGFSAQMISQAPELARQLGDELGKNPEDRDPDKLTSLISYAIQTGVFAPAAGHFGARDFLESKLTPHTYVARQLADQLRTAVLPDMAPAANVLPAAISAEDFLRRPSAVSVDPNARPAVQTPGAVELGATVATPAAPITLTKGFQTPEGKPMPPPSEPPPVETTTAAASPLPPEAAAPPAAVVPLGVLETETPTRPGGDVTDQQQSTAPGTPGAPVNIPEPVRVASGLRARKVFNSETQMNGPDILSWISENMPMMSKTAARRACSPR